MTGLTEDDEMILYINGEKVAHDRCVSIRSSPKPTPDNIVIGRKETDFDYNYASVIVDELAIWDKILTPNQIQAIFNMSSNAAGVN